MEVVRCFVGFDPREAVAYHVCCQSILETCSVPVSFHPVRGERRDGSNDFTYGRFLVPYQCGFKGHALYIDGDMLVRGDLAELWALRRHDMGVQVVQHDYKTRFPVKYLGNKNEDYPRKNFSSVILWNCGFMPNRMLTPEKVESATGAELHRFLWLPDERIGELPIEWNKLVLEQDLSSGDRLRHFTIGLPAFREYANCPGADEWWAAYDRMIKPLVR